MRRTQVVGAAVVAAVVVAGVAVVALRADGDDDEAVPEEQIREELLDGLAASADCPDAAEPPALDDGQVRVTVVRVVDGCLAYTGESVDAADVGDRLSELRADPDVVAADRAVARTPGVAASPGLEDRSAEQWALAPEHLDAAAVRELWPATADVRVAVIDTGIDPEHADLAGQVVERAPWSHRYEGDYDGHGSHVAGIVAAADDGAGVVGLTPGARLMDVQYYDGKDDLAGPSDDLGEYVRWSVDHGADVINMSIQGESYSDTELTAALYAERQGVVVVGIAGNCGGEDAGNTESWRPPWDSDPNPCKKRNEPKWPASFATVLSVGAHDQDGERADFSSANSSVDISAPGVDILSDCLAEDGDDRVTCEASGTSQAAPYVSAVVALLRARHPDASPEAIRTAISESARTEYHQPLDTRSDEFGWGIIDPEAAAAYLDEHPGAEQSPVEGIADRTQALYVDPDDNQVMVVDDGVPHPVRRIDPDASVNSVDWSADHSRLVASSGDTLFTWTGPGSQVVETTCDGCDVAYLDRGDVVAGLAFDGTITRYDRETLESLGTATIALPNADDGFVLYGDVGGKLLVAHSESPESTGPDTLYLVDPLSGEASGSYHSTDAISIGDVAVDADGEQVGLLTARAGGACERIEHVVLLDPDDLGEVVGPAEVPSGDMKIDEVFFNGDALYATMRLPEDGCGGSVSNGVWRLDPDTRGWEQVSDEPVMTVRPVEGLTGDPSTGRISVTDDGRIGTFVPTGAPGSEHVALGVVNSLVEATPTRDEVDLARESSTPPIDEGGGGGSDGGGSDDTTEAAIARYETYLHALGEGDVDTLCEIAGPGMEQAEDEVGPCPEAFEIVIGMIAPDQATALRTATVDPALVDASTPGEVFIPVEAVVADATFGESDLGSYTLRFQDGDWFIVD
jgi:subtilisin family serine protease